LREVSFIIVHCSDSDFGDVDEIRRWHVEDNKWSDIGYHYVITNGHLKSGSGYNKNEDAIIQTGRPIDVAGAHAKNLNSHSIGICLVGKHHFTWEQFACLRDLLNRLKEKYPDARIIGHCDSGLYGGQAGGKTCPNFNVGNFDCVTRR